MGSQSCIRLNFSMKLARITDNFFTNHASRKKVGINYIATLLARVLVVVHAHHVNHKGPGFGPDLNKQPTGDEFPAFASSDPAKRSQHYRTEYRIIGRNVLRNVGYYK